MIIHDFPYRIQGLVCLDIFFQNGANVPTYASIDACGSLFTYFMSSSLAKYYIMGHTGSLRLDIKLA
jgi:hypothetical protein